MTTKNNKNIIYFLIVTGLLVLVLRLWFIHAVFVDNVTVRYPADAAETKSVNMPFTLKSTQTSADFEVEATIYHHPTQTGIIRFAPDDCILEASLNGQDITPLFDKDTCWPAVQVLNVSGLLKPGNNHFKAKLHDKDIDYGLRIFGVASVPEIMLMAACLAAAFYLLSAWVPYHLLAGLNRYWLVSLVPLAGFALMSITEWPRHPFGLSILRSELLPVHIAFLLWLHGTKLFEHHPPVANRRMIALALAGFVTGCLLFSKNMQWLRLVFIWGALFCSYCIFIRPHTMWETIRSHRRFSIVAVACGLCALGYYFLQETIWRWMVYTTGMLIRTVMIAVGVDAEILGSSTEPVKIITDVFNIRIHQPCSGLEGIFLFWFLLSVLLMADWKVFGRFRVWPLYVFGYFYMYVMNAIRIGALFLLGHFSWQPDAPAWMQSLRGAPFELFHTYTGWVIYLAAFMLFASWMYRRARIMLINDKCGSAYE